VDGKLVVVCISSFHTFAGKSVDEREWSDFRESKQPVYLSPHFLGVVIKEIKYLPVTYTVRSSS